MPYRDESEALRLRVKDLEEDLGSARETIARLQGERAKDDAADQKPSWFTGAPRRLDLERELPFALTDAGYEAIAEVMRARLPPQGQLSHVGRTLTWQTMGQELRVWRTEAGTTRVKLALDHKNAATMFGLALPGTVILALAPAAAALQAMKYSPASLIVVVPVVLALVYSAMRPLFARLIHKDRQRLTGVFEAVMQVAAQHAAPARVRLAPDEDQASSSALGEAAAQDDQEQIALPAQELRRG